MNYLKIVAKTIYSILILIIVVIASSLAFTVLRGPAGLRVFVVQSGSMEPAIKTGSIVVVMPQKSYRVKDVITFLSEPGASLKDPKSTVTHRIVEVKKDKKTKLTSFLVKGDANKTKDQKAVQEKQVLGKVVLSVPKVGYAIAFSKTQMGFVMLIIIPATLIVYSELINIKNEVAKMLAKRKSKTEEKNEELK